MAYDEALAARIRAVTAREPLNERKMFGGLCFLRNGHMVCGVTSTALMVRVGAEAHEAALALPHARPMDFTGRPLKGMVYVDPAGLRGDAALQAWLVRGLNFVDSLPPKMPGEGKAKRGHGGGSRAKAPRAATSAGGSVPATLPERPAGARKTAAADPGEGAPFSGFGRPTLRFLRGLAGNNEKTWFEAHRAEYEAHVLTPAKAFVTALGPRLASISSTIRFEPRVNGSLFRINRDVRFSKDKTPYKPHLDLWFWEGDRKGWDAPGFFFRLAPRQLTLGVGMHHFEKPSQQAFRAAVLDVRHGKALAAALARVEGAGPYKIGGPRRKTVPRGLPKDHPRANLLLCDGLVATLEQSPPLEAGSKAFVEWCFAHYRQMAPLHHWLLGLR